jgi:glutathione S-transferase
MELFFMPLACSMATRISLYEANADATFVYVDGKTKLTDRGEDYRAINPLCLVPTIRTDDGEVIMENAAVLQWIAERYPAAALGPADAPSRTRLRQWLSFIATELHMKLQVLLDRSAPDGAKRYALDKLPARLSFVDRHLADREHLLDRFTVADALLVTVLHWTIVTPVKLDEWPSLSAYVGRLRDRPSVARALAEETPMYLREQQTRRAP